MKRILLVCLTAVFALASSELWAQERTVTGKVTDAADGSSLPGVNVVVKGTATGAVTDAEGKYSISVPQSGGVLVFSFIGLTSQEVEIGSRSSVDVQMAQDVQQLTEVVVTATGVERNSKEIVYANQTVKAEDLLSTPNKNALEAMRGKTAGVRLSTGSGSVGASTRIVLRGESSLTGNNNALIVVDGMPINNDATSGGAGTSTTGYADHGNRFNDINPDDIESMTILKGPSATSLYGSRGAAGVVMITTKKGGKKMEVGLNSSFSQEKAYVLTKRQNKFGQGYNGDTFDSGENFSWGPEVDGVVRPWTSPVDTDGDGDLEVLTRPYSAVPDQLQEFFNIGNTLSNAVHISGSSGGFTYYASYSNLNQNGILDNTKYKRNTVTFNASAKLSDKLRSDFKVSYANVKQNTAQEGSRAFDGNNAWASVLQSPINIPISELRDYKNGYHGIDGYWGSYNSTNPYFILNEYGNEGNIQNFLGNGSLTYDIMKGLSVTGKFGTNIISTTIETSTPKYKPKLQQVWGNDLALTERDTRYASLGEYTYYNKTNVVLDFSGIANYNTKLNENFSLDVSAGYNFYQTNVEWLEGKTFGGLVTEGVYNLSNSVQAAQSTLDRTQYRIVGVLGNARIGYKNAAFLELSARNDKSSTLPKENNGFFYTAVGASAVLTELFPTIENKVLSFAKLRTSYGTTGRDADPYLLATEYFGNPEMVFLSDYSLKFPWLGQPGFTTGNRIGNNTLQPELTTTFEIGTDLGFFNERVNLAYTYYSSVHSKQIVIISLPSSTGFTSTPGNVGEMTNKGHELTLSVKPIEGLVDGLDLEIFGSYAKNVSEVTKVTDQIDELVLGTFSTSANSSAVSVVAKEGKPFGTFKGIAQRTNAAGQIVVSPTTGFPLESVEDEYFGTFAPDYISSFGMNANYKGIGFNILFDVRQGGQFISQTKDMIEFNGTGLTTIVGDRQPFVLPNSVIDNGDGTFSPNTTEIDAEGLYTVYGNPTSTTLIDASFVKLREIGLSYTFPKNLLSKTPFKTARFSLFAKNVKFWLPSENTYADPEINGPALTGLQGIETTQTPPSRSFGASLSLTF